MRVELKLFSPHLGPVSHLAQARKVFDIELAALKAVRAQLDGAFEQAVDLVAQTVGRHGKIVGMYLSRDRIEALIESMELLSNSEFARALKDYESGRMKFYDVDDLDKAMSR